MALRVALVGGPMYDGLYSMLPEGTEVVVHADHPTLNRGSPTSSPKALASTSCRPTPSTVPSQAPWLQPLDPTLADGMANQAVDLCTFEGALLCVPRNIDVRVMWVRHDLVDRAPATWAELLASDVVFGFTGRESGLFGTFFEYVAAHGGDVFDTALTPTLATPLGEEAVAALCRLAGRAARRPAVVALRPGRCRPGARRRRDGSDMARRVRPAAVGAGVRPPRPAPHTFAGPVGLRWYSRVPRVGDPADVR